MLRGGSWNNNPENCRSAYRNRNNPDNRNDVFGFRVACAAASTLLYQSWRMGIRRESQRRVQTCSSDGGDGIRKSTEPGSLVGVKAERLPGSDQAISCFYPDALTFDIPKVQSRWGNSTFQHGWRSQFLLPALLISCLGSCLST